MVDLVMSREREMTKDFFWLFFVGSTYSLENEQQGLESEIIPPTSQQQQQAQQLVQQQNSLTKPTALPSLAYDSSNSDEFYSQQPSSHQPFVNTAEGSSSGGGCNNPMQNSFQDSSSISYDEYYHHQIHTSSSTASSQSSDNLVMHSTTPHQHFYKEEDYSYYYNNNYNYEYNHQGEYSGYSSDSIAAATDTYNGYFCQHHATCTTAQQSCDVTYAQY